MAVSATPCRHITWGVEATLRPPAGRSKPPLWSSGTREGQIQEGSAAEEVVDTALYWGNNRRYREMGMNLTCGNPGAYLLRPGDRHSRREPATARVKSNDSELMQLTYTSLSDAGKLTPKEVPMRKFVLLFVCSFVLLSINACESGGGNGPNDTPGVDVADDEYTPPDGEEIDVNAEISGPDIELLDCGNGICEPDKGENLLTCLEDCQNQGDCGNFICEPDKFEDPITCSNDCEELEHCGDDDCNYAEDCLNCPADCGCEEDQVCIQPIEGVKYVCSDVEDPLEPYYWIEGEWKCVESDGMPCMGIDLVSITVDGWTEENGAVISGFKPCSNGHAKESDNENEILFSGESQTGTTICPDGTFNKDTEELNFNQTTAGMDTNHTWKYEKQ